MEYCNTSPNQWNPETDNDNEKFDEYMRKLATIDDQEFERLQKQQMPVPEIPKLKEDASFEDRLNQIAIAFEAFLVDRENKTVRGELPMVFKSHTPADARKYLGSNVKVML